MKKKQMETLKNDDAICIIRFICNNKNIAQLVEVIENLYTPSSNMVLNIDKSNINVEYYKNNGNNRLLKQVYDENVESDFHFKFNNLSREYFVRISQQDFIHAENDKKILIFEALYDEIEKEDKNFENISDPINFHYFLLIMAYMKNKNIRFGVFVSKKSKTNFYTPLDDKIYYQIRTFLYFCEDDQNDKIYFIRLSDKKVVWTRLFSNAKNERKIDKSFGRILPLLPINCEMYKVIQRGAGDLLSASDGYYQELIDCYKNRICNEYAIESKVLNDCCLYDNYIEEIIFLSTLYYCLEDYTEYKNYELSILHETCVDYAQGILQLIENVCFHAIGEELIGCGNFSIRIRKSTEMSHFLATVPTKDWSYFMEIYVTDLIYDSVNFCGIVNKLYSNISTRYEELDEENEKRVLMQVLETRGTDQGIKLSEVFGNNMDTNCAYDAYLNHSINVAYHYGLQILNNAISVGEGYMCVRSGEGADNFYSDNNGGIYNDQMFNWKNGTAYIIYLPLDLTEVIDYHDSIAISNEPEEICLKYKVEMFPEELLAEVVRVPLSTTPRLKEKHVLDLVDKIDDNMVEKDIIYYIDCWGIDKKYSYEILAKFLFLCLIKKDFCNIAIVNVKNRQEVVKLFRQFALFYNRQGKNEHMKDKSVFIVDSKAQIDLLLKGTIGDIKEDMYRSQIYGGIDEISMRIIEHLGKRGH